MSTPLDQAEEELCCELGIRAAEVCRDDAATELPPVCPVTLETARGIGEDAGIPCSKLDDAAVVVLEYARRRWEEIFAA